MAARGFSPDDPLFKKVFVASATLTDLTHDLPSIAYLDTYQSRHGSDGERKPR